MRIPSKEELRHQPALVAYGWALVAATLQLALRTLYVAGGVLLLFALVMNLVWWCVTGLWAFVYHSPPEGGGESASEASPDDRTIMLLAGIIGLPGTLGAVGGVGWSCFEDRLHYVDMLMNSTICSMALGLVAVMAYTCWWIVTRGGRWLRVRAGRGESVQVLLIGPPVGGVSPFDRPQGQ